MLIHADGFGHYATAHYLDVYPDGTPATASIGAFGPNGASGMRFSGDRSLSVRRETVTTSGAICIAQFDFRISGAPDSENILFDVLLGGVSQCTLDLNTDRTLSVWRGPVGSKTQLGSNSTYVVPLDTHIHIEVKFTIANAGGSIVVHVWENGDEAAQVVLNVTGVDTQFGATATWDGFSPGAGCEENTDWANLVVMDGSGASCNDFLGPADVIALFASDRETPALTAWALSAGSSIPDLVDDATPDDDTTYVSEGTQNDQFTVTVDPVPYPSRAILGAQFYGSVKLTSGSPTVKAIGYQSATPNLGATFSPTSAYTYAMEPYSAMPNGSAFSTAAAFDALQWGLKLTSASTGVRATQIVVALIQERVRSRNNLLAGFTNTVRGDDNVATGQSNTLEGAGSQVHGRNGTMQGNRSVLFNQDGTVRTETGDGKFVVYGEFGGDLEDRLVPPYPGDAAKFLDGTGAFSVPGGASGGGSVSALDVECLRRAQQGLAIYSGCAPSEDAGGPSLDVDVAAGHIRLATGAGLLVTAGSVTLDAADATNDRIDLVWVNTSGTLGKTTGTPAATPVPPALPSNSILLAIVSVPATDTTITNAQITDKRTYTIVQEIVMAVSDDSDIDNTVHNDPELLLAVGPSRTYEFEAWIQFSSGASSTPDVKFNFTFPSGATLSHSVMALQQTSTSTTTPQWASVNSESSPSTAIQRGIVANQFTVLHIRGTLIMSTTPGTLQFQFAQDVTTGGTPTVRESGSWMKLTPIG